MSSAEASMEIVFTKLSDQKHAVKVRRRDGSEDSSVLDSRSFLRHDLAHLAVELELPLSHGYWGSVAAGASLAGQDMGGTELMTAEKLAGPVQTLMRLKADVDQYQSTLQRIVPEQADLELANRIRERGRALQGHWQATPYGGDMVLQWQEDQ